MKKASILHPMKYVILCFLVAFLSPSDILGQKAGKPLVLQEMTWTDVREYLKTDDMVIIPLGSTEQHGPHLPLGSDFYEAKSMSMIISARTGVVVAPVLLAGYSVYHSGFTGTLSLKPETVEQVLFETAEMLIKYGFRRIMFFNHHGGNRVVESKVIHRINQTTEAVAVSIGIGAPFQRGLDRVEGVAFDVHAGISETSMMLFLKPELVRMERAEKPELSFTPRVRRLLQLSKEHPELEAVVSALRGVPEETKKGGASHEISSNGIWSTGDPKKATRDRGERAVSKMVEAAVKFIQAWRKEDKSRF